MRINKNLRLTLSLLLPLGLATVAVLLYLLRTTSSQETRLADAELTLRSTQMAVVINETLARTEREAVHAAQDLASSPPAARGQHLQMLSTLLAARAKLEALWVLLPQDGGHALYHWQPELSRMVLEQKSSLSSDLPLWTQQHSDMPQWLAAGSGQDDNEPGQWLAVKAEAKAADGSLVQVVAALRASSLPQQMPPLPGGPRHWLLLKLSGEIAATDDRRNLGRPYTDWAPAGSARASLVQQALRAPPEVINGILLPDGIFRATWAPMLAPGWQLVVLEHSVHPLSLGLSELILLATLLLALLLAVVLRKGLGQRLRQLVSQSHSLVLNPSGMARGSLAAGNADPLRELEHALQVLADQGRGDKGHLLSPSLIKVIGRTLNPTLSTHDLVQQLAAALPEVVHSPGKASARVELLGVMAESQPFVETPHGVFAPVVIDGATVGSVWLYTPQPVAGLESQALIDAIAQHLVDVTRVRRDRDNDESQRLAMLRSAESRAGVLQKSERLLRDITNSMPGVIFQLAKSATDKFSLRYVSAGVSALFGVSREQVLASFDALGERLYPEDYASFTQVVAGTAQGQELIFNFRITHGTTAELRWIRAAATLIAEDHGAWTLNGTWLDITAQKKLETALESARQEADNANAAKGRFLANMSHEIRTPMNAIIGLTHLASNQATEYRVKEYLHKVQDAAHSLLSLLNDILDFSKIEAGRLVMERIPFDLKRVIDRVQGLMAERAASKGLELQLSIANDAPRSLMGDPLRLSQVLLNLASNAIKFTEKGYVRIAVEVAKASPVRPQLRFTVRDSGPGMDEEQKSRLFSAFSQADTSTTRRFGGTGLGLSISKQLVTLMGGELSVSSSPGQGASFRFSLQFDTVISEAFEATIGPEPVGRLAATIDTTVTLNGARVLVVDDNAINLEIAAELLKGWGVQVVLATSGIAALEVLSKQPVDAVLMDVQMPHMDGYAATGHIRANQSLARLPVIAMTANAMHGDREKCIASGMNDHLPKPINPQDLQDTLLRWLRHAQRGQLPAV